MPAELINILTQVPIVAVFVWFSSQMQRQFQEFLREEREARGEQMQAMGTQLMALAQEIKSMQGAQEEHDKRVSQAFAVLLDRVCPPAAPRGGTRK